MDKVPSIATLCDTLIDSVCERGECDFVRDLAAPLPLVQVGNTWSGTLKFPIPADKSLADLTLFAQGIFIDAASNAFGSVWSNGVAMTLVGEGPGQLVYQSDSTSASGGFLFGSQATGAPVIELTGSVQ